MTYLTHVRATKRPLRRISKSTTPILSVDEGGGSDYKPPRSRPPRSRLPRATTPAPSPRRTDAHGRPCNPDAWYALYMRVSGPAQRESMSWPELVRRQGLPAEWASMYE